MLAVAGVATLGHGLNEAFTFSTQFEVVQGLRLVALFTTAGCLNLFRDRVPLAWPVFTSTLALLVVAVLVKGFAMALIG